MKARVYFALLLGLAASPAFAGQPLVLDGSELTGSVTSRLDGARALTDPFARFSMTFGPSRFCGATLMAEHRFSFGLFGLGVSAFGAGSFVTDERGRASLSLDPDAFVSAMESAYQTACQENASADA